MDKKRNVSIHLVGGTKLTLRGCDPIDWNKVGDRLYMKQADGSVCTITLSNVLFVLEVEAE